MDISSLLNGDGGANDRHPTPSSASASARMGKERVQRPCASCGMKNHIRSTHCSRCSAQLRLQSRFANPSASASGSTHRAAVPAPELPGLRTGGAGAQGAGHPPAPMLPLSGQNPHGSASLPAPHAPASSHGHHRVPGRYQAASSPAQAGSQAEHHLPAPATSSAPAHGSRHGHHSSSHGTPSRSSAPPPVRFPQHQQPPKKRRSSNEPPSSAASGSAAAPGSSATLTQESAGSSNADRSSESASVRAQRVMRPCTACGAKNHIRSGICKSCGQHIENLGRQRRKGSAHNVPT
jgi:hypothetical protein